MALVGTRLALSLVKGVGPWEGGEGGGFHCGLLGKREGRREEDEEEGRK